MASDRIQHAYGTSLDRAGLALAAGGAVGGVFAGALAAIGSESDPLVLAIDFATGTVITMMAAVALGGPLWLLCNAIGWRGPGMAILVGALAGFLLFLGGQTYGFGLFDMPVSDEQTSLFRLISAVASSLILSLPAALVGWTIWRVAYRRIR